MNSGWSQTWDEHADLFVARNWQECPSEKKKAWHLPNKFAYFQAGETALRVGIVASAAIPREEELLLAGVMWGNRLSNGAKTVIYFVAPDFSPFFLEAMGKIGGVLNTRAVYWRERLTPSLYLVPEQRTGGGDYPTLGELRPSWRTWGQGLNPVARQQLEVVRAYFAGIEGIRCVMKAQQIAFLWGHLEIAEIVRRGKKFELGTKAKWEKDPELMGLWQKAGWVEASGHLNQEFCHSVDKIIIQLRGLKERGLLKARELLDCWLYQSAGVVSTLWGRAWEWPWLPAERGHNWVTVLGQWHYFTANGQMSIVLPVLERPMAEASLSLILAVVLEKSALLSAVTDDEGRRLEWDGRVQWLTLPEWEQDLRRWHCWLKAPEQFPIWVLPEGWQKERLENLSGSFSP
ncbi:hypothetical protein CEB3_c15160 [Peptococcaceae bacterium CEB3]|nr:hypothetical protein CEB3_c15160 [Peptococcaceae bacterium CEB3]